MANLAAYLLNNVSSTVQAGSTAIGSASATGINVATGDGAKFGTINANQYVPAVIVDTSTSPETIKEYVWITSRSTDALTVTRQAEDSATYAASTTTVAAGYTIAAVGSARSLDALSALRERYQKPDQAFAETIHRSYANSSGSLTSGTLFMQALALPKDRSIGHIGYLSSAAASSPTHYWFGLFDSSLNLLALTADQTTTAWGANTAKSLAVATIASGAASAFVTTYTGLYYIGMMCTAATPPTVFWAASSSTPNSLAPILAGSSNTGMTTPPAFPFTATALTASLAYIYGFVGD